MAAIIARLQQNIRERIRLLSVTRDALAERVRLVEGIEEGLRNLMGNCGSCAQENRNVMTLNLQESLRQHQEQIREYNVTIKRLEDEIADYEAQKRDWERKYGQFPCG